MAGVRARARRGDNNRLSYDTGYGETKGGLRRRKPRCAIGESDRRAAVELRVRMIGAVVIGQPHTRVATLF